MLSGKKCYFTALAEYHQATVAKDKGAFGEQVTRLKVCSLLLLENFQSTLNMTLYSSIQYNSFTDLASRESQIRLAYTKYSVSRLE